MCAMDSSLLLQAVLLSAIPMRQANLFVKHIRFAKSHRRQRTVISDRGRGTNKPHAHTHAYTYARAPSVECAGANALTSEK